MSNGKTELDSGEIRELIEQATALSADYGSEVEEAVRAATEAPLEEDRAMRLYVRVLKILRAADADGLSAKQRKALVKKIEREAEDAVASVKRPNSRKPGSLALTERNGLAPREVLPIPTFNEMAIPMQEGYVDVEDLRLWKGNHRLELHVAEFREQNHREPSDDELVKIMHGSIQLPSLDKSDPFKLVSLARSIARKGVEKPPIITFDGVPKDGNRRLAASLLVLHGKEFTDEQKKRARYVRVWQTPKNTTEDQFDAIVVAQNFESDYKEDWPEYIKARLVVEDYNQRREAHHGRFTGADNKQIKEAVAKRFALKPAEVTRYISMVQWAEDFEAFHVDAGQTPASVRYKTDDIFQWFYELDAGKADEKLTRKLDNDDDLKTMVYEMMFDLFDSGLQVRSLHKVLNDADATQLLQKAYEVKDKDPDEALEFIDEAIALAKRKNAKRRSVGFEDLLKTVVDRLGGAPPDQWKGVDSALLIDVRRVCQAAIGAIDGQVSTRRAGGEKISVK
ncbi:MAG: hypothetical protein ACRDKI_03925 [Solirubrobacterales bacterium]